MNIISISLAKKNNANVFICVTESGEYQLHSDIIVKHGIKVGEVDDNSFFNAIEESACLIGYNLVLKYVGAGIKTEKQIKDYLYRKEYQRIIIDRIIEKLKEYKIIDDKVYADTYIRSNPNFSKMKIRQKLSAGGVKSELIDESIEPIDDFASGIKHAEKFMRNKEYTRENIDKLIRRLTYLGYHWDTINKVLNQLKCNTEDI